MTLLSLSGIVFPEEARLALANLVCGRWGMGRGKPWPSLHICVRFYEWGYLSGAHCLSDRQTDRQTFNAVL